MIDPGIGFGKTLQHNLEILRRISLYHGLGVPLLLGASRKSFIGTLGGGAGAAGRDPGSLAVTLAAVAQGCRSTGSMTWPGPGRGWRCGRR